MGIKKLLQSIGNLVCALLAFLFFTLNMTFCGALFFLLSPFKIFFWSTSIQKTLSKCYTKIASLWISINNLNILITQRIEWKIIGESETSRLLNKKNWYFILANHQSALDIIVLQKVFSGKIPFLKFFIKKELFWLPLLGQCWWLLDFPFLKRNKHKQKTEKKIDFNTIRKISNQLKQTPTSIISFLEGTRLNKNKQKELTISPYKNLLKPKAGGFALVLETMGKKLNNQVIDVTIFYPQGAKSLLALFFGQVKKVVIQIRCLDIPKDLIGKYEDDANSREKIYDFINKLWQEKDKSLLQLKKDFC